MSHALHHHGRNITEWFPTVTHRQGTDCGELMSAAHVPRELGFE